VNKTSISIVRKPGDILVPKKEK